jgi:hypothetical protein
MKKGFTVALAVLIFVQLFAVPAALGAEPAGGGLKDIGKHWAKETILELVDRGIINGYADGTFRPDNPINRDEYIKLVVSALGFELANGAGYWAQPFISKALDLGLIYDGEFSSFNTPISREEMAGIIVRTADLNEEPPVYTYDHHIPAAIGDLKQANLHYQDEIVRSYRYGLITGKKAGVFDPKGHSTRAEAATVITRLLNAEYRNPFGAYIENHLAMKTADVADIDDLSILPAFYEKFRNTRNMQKYASIDELRETIIAVRELTSRISYEREGDLLHVTIPEHDERQFLVRLGTRSGQYLKSGTYTIDLNEPKPDGKPLIFVVIISDNQRGSVILETYVVYWDGDKIVSGSGNIEYDKALNGGHLEDVAIY